MAIEKKYRPLDLQQDVAIGVKLPFTNKRGGLFELSYSTEEQLLSNLKNLILTRKGERVYQPAFGTTLQDALFEQNDDIMRKRIEYSIKSAIDFWLPYIGIMELTVNPVIASSSKIDEHGIVVKLTVQLNGRDAEITLTFLVTPTLITINE
jgi:phage baseplate assembly protein W